MLFREVFLLWRKYLTHKKSMEVHHHAHHEGVKNWKSYLKEFFMLFLAVLCGFLAEWRFEQMIENHREEEYIHSIVQDINADISQTEKLVVALNSSIEKIDSLLMVLSSEDIKKNSNKAFELWRATIGFPDFVQNDRTIQQLKSSGSLRTIRKEGVSDKIMEYDQAVRLLSVTQNNMNSVASNISLFSQTFNFIELNKKPVKIVPLSENGRKALNEAYANRFFWKSQLVRLQKKLTLLGEKGKETSGFIKEKYRLE
jgi:hypothetical protein